MKRNIFAVCDLEVDYALNFMDYMNRKKNIPFEIQAFTSVENLIAYGKQTHIELLLISGRAMCREVRDLDIGKIIILSEGVHPPELDQYPSVYKYQSSSGTGEPMIKGGRYNGLMKHFGKPAASIGFALEVDNLLLALSSQKLISEKEEKPEVIEYEPQNRTEAIKEAQKLRAEGRCVALRLKKEAR